MILEIATPRAFAPLLQDARYLGAHGGRGSGKSHFFAEKGVERCLLTVTRMVCLREIQKSIKQSIKLLLEDKIKKLKVSHRFDILENEIRVDNGGLIIFQGMQNHTADSIKSLEGFDIALLVEAAAFSERSLDLLRPTIRKDGSQIWAEWNPDEEEDAIDQLLRGPNPPKDSIIVEANWRDNPFLPEVLRVEMEEDKARNYQKYLHVWEGGYNVIVEGAIFAEELTQAQSRITIVPIKSGIAVQTYWDLGQSDSTAIWFVQQIGLEYHVVDYYQNSGQKMDHYIDVLAKRKYLFDEHFLPHDAEHEQLAAKDTIKKQLQDAIKANSDLGKTVTVVPRIAKKTLAIDAARSIFPLCVFDKEKTKAGLKCLRKYSYAKDVDTGKVSKEPKHDIWSHGADAFLCFAQHHKRPQTKIKSKPTSYQGGMDSWMGA